MLEENTVLKDRYRIRHQIGKGGMGTVYTAKDENLGVTVAIKQNFYEEPRLIEAFKREARLLASLRHTALPQVKDYFVDIAGQFLVMEYIGGDDLETILQERKQKIPPAGEAKPFDVDEVVLWAEQLLDALDYLHTRAEPVIHRDIKPANLKLAERSQIILLDFGLAKGKPLQMTRVTTTGSIYGYTPNYAPIEQIRGIGTDPRSDLYALGATLYHLIVGIPPVDAATRADSFLGGEPDPLLPPHKLNPKVPQSISEVLMKAMEQHRNRRPAFAGEMLEMLRAAKRALAINPQEVETIEIETELEEETCRADEAETQLESDETKTEGDERRRQQARTESEETEGREQGRKATQQPDDQASAISDTSELTGRKANKKWLALGGVFLAVVALAAVIFLMRANKNRAPISIVTGADNFARIEPGEFMMGSDKGDPDEKPVHRVRVSYPFEIGKCEVTQAQWEAVMDSNPSNFKDANLPVENVSWNDAQQFIQKLNAQNDGYVYRLPTEAEWEYACRAGSTENYAGNLDEMAWYGDNSGGRSHPVEQKRPNAGGLYDMHGNVWEWCQDSYNNDYYTKSPSVDPQGPSSGSDRVKRGGGWRNGVLSCRSADRGGDPPDNRLTHLGFRLARTPR